MASLYELTGQYKSLEMAIALNPDDEDLQKELSLIDDSLESKAENYGKLIRNMEADLDGLAKEIERLTLRRNGIKNTNDRMKANLMASMVETGKTKFKTDLFSFGVAKNGGKLPVVIDVETEKLPTEFQKVTVEADKDAIRRYIEETGDLTYAHFADRGSHLSIR